MRWTTGFRYLSAVRAASAQTFDLARNVVGREIQVLRHPAADPRVASVSAEPTVTSTGAGRSSGGLTVGQGAALTIGAVLGTGVISLPALAAGVAGPASLLAWLALVLLSIPLAGTFAALGARHPDAGGVSTYVRRAFGAKASAMVGWCFYFAIPIGAPPAAMFAGNYVAEAVGGGRGTSIATAAVLIVAVGATNAFGVRISGRVQLALAAVLAALLLTTTIAALPHARWSNITPFAPHGWSSIGAAAALLVWGFAGWEVVTSLSADYRHPRRDIPRATRIAVVVVGVLYLGIATAGILVLGPAAGTSRAPLADLLATAFGAPARAATALIALLLTVGAMNAYFAGGAKLGAALGRDGALPTWFSRGSRSPDVPRRSLSMISALSVLALAVTAVARFDLHTSVLVTTGSFTLVYLLGTAAAMRLLPRPGWAWTGAAISFAAVLILLVLTGWHLLWGLGVALVALLYQFLRGRPAGPSGPDREVVGGPGAQPEG